MRLAMRTIGILLAIVTLQATDSRSDYPPPRNISEMVPPTEEEWFRYYLRKEMRKGVPQQAKCDLCEEIVPILLYERWYFYLCPWSEPCGVPVHRSFRGTYGIFLPGPYYIETPRMAVQFPDPNCPDRKFEWYQEEPYIP
jgi:hypothetical protein